jgi:hypothetical protein
MKTLADLSLKDKLVLAAECLLLLNERQTERSYISRILITADGDIVDVEAIDPNGIKLSVYEDVVDNLISVIPSKWCCNLLRNLYGSDISSARCTPNASHLLYKYFDPGTISESGGGWWDSHECEARIYALLLCAELCDDES